MRSAYVLIRPNVFTENKLNRIALSLDKRKNGHMGSHAFSVESKTLLSPNSKHQILYTD